MIYAQSKEGTGRVVGWVSRAKKIHAILVIRKMFVAVPIEELKIVRVPKK